METVTNFRDLGGIINNDGSVVRDKKLLRSGELSRVSQGDQLRLLEKYELGKVIDLRSDDEVNERPDKKIKNADYVHINIFKDVVDEGSSLEDFTAIGAADHSRAYMTETYQTMAVNKGSQEGFTQMIELVLETITDNSLLFHCFAGKDRTGVSAALLLEILNVPKAEIYRDYLITNELRKKENAEIIELARVDGMADDPLEALEIALNVEPAYLDKFYETVENEFGGINEYLRNELQISLSMQNDLRKLLLTDR